MPSKIESVKMAIKSKLPNWSDLYSIGKSRIIRSSYFWFIFVPIIEKMFSTINKNTLMKNLGVMNFNLPFSWQMFFFGATFIAIGNLIYTIWCPKVIKKYKTYYDFKKEGQSKHQLLELYSGLIVTALKSNNKFEIINNFGEFYRSYCTKNDTIATKLESDNLSIFPIIPVLEIQEDQIGGAFNHVREVAQKMHLTAKSWCVVFYLIGLAFIVWVMGENILSVFKTTDIYIKFF